MKNDRKGQRQLFDQYHKYMFNMAYRITNNKVITYDVVQEAFISIFKDIKNFKRESTIGSWIKTIVVRKALRVLEIERKHDTEVYNEYEHDVAWNNQFDAHDLDKAIRSLPDKCRVIFLLIEKEGYKHREVAEMMNINEGTSKSQLFHAKKLLQQKLSRF